ncbi:DUF6303 family protein [Streptomyces sp. NPDC090054]|uniref:DUF6303 family protein n=1 Tax=Streptomyces sp. NPDC090054 TaxID=3365933 RepID=UPI00380449F4
MTNRRGAYCKQTSEGAWHLGVPIAFSHTGMTETAEKLEATEYGLLPPLDARTAALARLGYQPAYPERPASGWEWHEVPHEEHTGLIGSITVTPMPEAAS